MREGEAGHIGHSGSMLRPSWGGVGSGWKAFSQWNQVQTWQVGQPPPSSGGNDVSSQVQVQVQQVGQFLPQQQRVGSPAASRSRSTADAMYKQLRLWRAGFTSVT